MSVFIVEMTSGITTWKWLCDSCIARRKAAGWSVKAPMPMPAGTLCGDCEIERQEATGYLTPSVAFVPVGPDSHLPTREEVARMPGCKSMAPWAPPAKPKPRKQSQVSAHDAKAA